LSLLTFAVASFAATPPVTIKGPAKWGSDWRFRRMAIGLGWIDEYRLVIFDC